MIARLAALIAVFLIPLTSIASSAQVYSLALLHSYGIQPYTDAALIEHLQSSVFSTEEFEAMIQNEFASHPQLSNDLLIWSGAMSASPSRRTADSTTQAIRRVNHFFDKVRPADSWVLRTIQERIYDIDSSLKVEAFVSIWALLSHSKARKQVNPNTLASHQKTLKSIFSERSDELTPLFNEPKYRERLLEFPVVMQKPSPAPADLAPLIEGIRSGKDAPAGWRKINDWIEPSLNSSVRFTAAMIPLIENYPDLLSGESEESQRLIKRLFASLERYRGELSPSALLSFREIAKRMPAPLDVAIVGVLLGRFNAEHGHALVRLNAASAHPSASLAPPVMTLSEWVASLPPQVKIDWDPETTEPFSQQVQNTVRRRLQDPSPFLKIGPEAFLNFSKYQPKAAYENVFDFFKNEYIDLLFASKPDHIPANLASILSRIQVSGSELIGPFYDAIDEKRVPDAWVDYLISRSPDNHPLSDRLAFHRAARKLRMGNGDWMMFYRNDVAFRESLDRYFRLTRSRSDLLVRAFQYDDVFRSFVTNAGSSALPPIVSQNADAIFEGLLTTPAYGNPLSEMQFNEQVFAWFMESKTLSMERKLFFIERFAEFAEAKYAEIPESTMPEVWKRKIIQNRNQLIEKNVFDTAKSIRQAKPCRWAVKPSSIESDLYRFSLN